MNFKKNKFVFFLFLLLPSALILNIYCSIPSKIIVSQNSEYSLNLNAACQIKENENVKSVLANNNGFVEEKENNLQLNTQSCGNYDLSVRLFNKIPIKTISVTVSPKKYIVPSGDTIGIKLYTKGLLVVGVSDFVGNDGKAHAPAKEAGIKEGDRIIKVNGVEVKTSEDFSKIVKEAQYPVSMTIQRQEQEIEVMVNPGFAKEDNSIKVGIWVRDSTAGIGTLTFYDPTTSSFAALGHAICDSDTGEIMTVRKGSIITCDVASVTKGTSGEPGELVGSFSGTNLGEIQTNSELGVYGTLDNYSEIEFSEALEAATRFQIKEGQASILADVDGKGVKEYSAEIVKLSKSARVDNKGMVIKITDEELIEKTGGIVQGMSGSPIIQNGKLVGAVTHVFVNDPTRGYGIFIENMLSEAEKIK